MPIIESLVVCAMPDIPSKFQKDPSITFRVILLRHRETNRQTKSDKNITSLAEVINFFCKCLLRDKLCHRVLTKLSVKTSFLVSHSDEKSNENYI